MPSDKPRFSGIVKSACGNGFFKVEVTLEEMENKLVLCNLSGKMRTNNIKIVGGDRVEVELDIYNMEKGRIVYRKR